MIGIIDVVQRFIRETRAGATALTAAAVTVTTVCGTALIVDHAWLIDQRDVLKTAADAGAVAATVEMSRQTVGDPDISDADLQKALQQVAERYVKLNLDYLPVDRLAHAESTLQVEALSDRVAGTVRVKVSADLGGTLFFGHIPLLGEAPDLGPVRTASLVESTKVPVEVALAIDVSGSMTRGLTGTPGVPEEQTRMALVRDASLALLEVLDPDPQRHVAVGIVPWHVQVRLDGSTQSHWTNLGWAEYPNSRYYAVPFRKRFSWLPNAPGISHRLALSAPEPWQGCLDEHRINNGIGHAAASKESDLSTPPQHLAFAQAFFPALSEHAYECAEDPIPTNLQQQFCYTERATIGGVRQRLRPAQYGCDLPGGAILPLTSDTGLIKDGIDALEPIGVGTYSTLGVLWGHRMLLPEWKRIWGGTHPLDPSALENEGMRKAIVLLTDGEDNYCGTGPGACVGSGLGIDRNVACALAKSAGHEIFVVAAMPPADISSALAESLRECSSEADNPDGTYLFINNEKKQSLRAAFVSIANQLQTVRKVY